MTPATPLPGRPSIAVIVGWVLTVPGFLAIAGVVADLTGLFDAARCAMTSTAGPWVARPAFSAAR